MYLATARLENLASCVTRACFCLPFWVPEFRIVHVRCSCCYARSCLCILMLINVLCVYVKRIVSSLGLPGIHDKRVGDEDGIFEH